VSSEALKDYLSRNATDFIKFKISILMEEAQNDPVKKADLVRDIIKSIAVIPNSIQREIYVQETSKLMEISEGVLYNSLAQQIVQNKKQVGEQRIEETIKMEVIAPSQTIENEINELEKYEKEIIKTLLLYGNHQTEFVDWEEEINALGKKEIKKKMYENSVAKEIYLNLQDDEIEFTHEVFREVYNIIVQQFNLNQNINIKTFTQHENQKVAQLASDIEMEEDKYVLSNWESRDIIVHPKETKISKQVTDIILNMRRTLIDQKIKSTLKSIKEHSPEREQMEEVKNYTNLRKLIFDKLHRIL
jgi:DNA primase